jgi:hypothetical protein
MERLDHRQDGLGLGGVAFERMHLEREPARIGQQADGDLRLQPPLLGEPGLTEPVALVNLEVQRGHVIDHQRGRPQPHVRRACPREPLPPLIAGVTGQPPHDRAIAGRDDPELVQHPDGVQLADRLDHPSQHQSLEHLVVAACRVEPEPGVGQTQPIPQMPGPGRGDRQRLTLRPAVTKVETVLVRVQPLPGDRLQRFHFLRRVRRPDVLDVAGPAPIGVHNLHRGRVTRRLHRPDKRHSHRLENHRLVHTSRIKTPSQAPLQRRNPWKWHKSGLPTPHLQVRRWERRWGVSWACGPRGSGLRWRHELGSKCPCVRFRQAAIGDRHIETAVKHRARRKQGGAVPGER